MHQINMQEIVLFPEDKLRLGPRELTDYLRERLPQLATVAEKLIETGSPIELTIGGLAFRPGWLTDEKHPDPAVLKEKLEALGIEEAVNPVPTRSYADLVDAEEELSDRVAYDDVDRELRNPENVICPCCEDQRIEEMSTLEKQYGRRSLMIPNEYERGVLHGKLEAVRWVLGDEWENPQNRAIGNQVEKLVEISEGLARIKGILDNREDLEPAAADSTCDHDEEK